MEDIQEGVVSHNGLENHLPPTATAVELHPNGIAPVMPSKGESIHVCLLELTKDDKLDQDRLGDYVTLLTSRRATLEEEFEMVTPLLLCDAKTLELLVVDHNGLEVLQRWISEASTRPTLLRILLKVVDKMIKKVPSCLFLLKESQMIDTLKEMRSHSDRETSAHAHEMVQHVKLLVADNDDPQLAPLRDALHEKTRRHLEISEQDESEEPSTKRPMLSASSVDDQTMIHIPTISVNSTPIELTQAPSEGQHHQTDSLFFFFSSSSSSSSSSATSPSSASSSTTTPRGISAKTGKPKKVVSWVSDDAHEETFFHKHLPVRYNKNQPEDWDDDGRRYHLADEIPWKVKKVDFSAEMPALVRSTLFGLNDRPTRAQSQETERQKMEYIALYLSDADIPQNPADAPEDQVNVVTPEISLLHIPFARRPATSSTPVLSHLQLHNTPPPSASASPSSAKGFGVGNTGIPYPSPSLLHGLSPALNQVQTNVSHTSQSNQGPHVNAPPYGTGQAPQSSAGGFAPPQHSLQHQQGGYTPPQQSQVLPPQTHYASHYNPNNHPHGPHTPSSSFEHSQPSVPSPSQPSYGGPPHNNMPSQLSPSTTEQALQMLAVLQQQARDMIPGYSTGPAGPPQPAPYSAAAAAAAAAPPPPLNGYPPLQHAPAPYQPQYHAPPPQYPPQHHGGPPPRQDAYPPYSHPAPYSGGPPRGGAPSYPPNRQPQRTGPPASSSPWVSPNEIFPTSFDFTRLRSQEDRAKFVCRHWKMSSGCDYGVKCNFLHPKDNEAFERGR